MELIDEKWPSFSTSLEETKYPSHDCSETIQKESIRVPSMVHAMMDINPDKSTYKQL